MTVVRAGTLKVDAFLTVIFAAQIRSGNERSRYAPLLAMFIAEEILVVLALKVFRRLLLLIFKTARASGLIPSMELKNVLEIVISDTSVTVAGNVTNESAGRANHSIFLTDFKSNMSSVERRDKLLSAKDPPIEPIVELPRLVNSPAFWQIRSPEIACGPSMEITPAALEDTKIDPEIVAQLAKAVASG